MNGAFNCVQAVVSKGMDHTQRIQLINQINFLEILEHFKMQNTTMDMDVFENENILNEEQFFHLMAGAINRLGIWSLELQENVKTFFG